jgi:hypothetical protein
MKVYVMAGGEAEKKDDDKELEMSPGKKNTSKKSIKVNKLGKVAPVLPSPSTMEKGEGFGFDDIKLQYSDDEEGDDSLVFVSRLKPTSHPTTPVPFFDMSGGSFDAEMKEEMQSEAAKVSFAGKLNSLLALSPVKIRKDAEIGKVVPFTPVAVRRLNQAILIVKPSAITVSVQFTLSTILDAAKVRVLTSAKLTGPEIRTRKIFNRQFADSKSFATLISAANVVMNKEELERFTAKFAMEWSAAVADKRAMNANEAREYLKIGHDELYSMWKLSPQLRIRKGLHIACLTTESTASPSRQTLLETPLFVVNGYFGSMRDQMVSPLHETQFMLIEWDAASLSWSDMLTQFIGDSDPATAFDMSLRGILFRDWEKLGLKTQPDRRDNCVHISCSALEGLNDRLTWIKGAMLFTDPFGMQMITSGISTQRAQQWLANPFIDNDSQMHVFDLMHGLDDVGCIEVAEKIMGDFLYICCAVMMW